MSRFDIDLPKKVRMALKIRIVQKKKIHKALANREYEIPKTVIGIIGGKSVKQNKKWHPHIINDETHNIVARFPSKSTKYPQKGDPIADTISGIDIINPAS